MDFDPSRLEPVSDEDVDLSRLEPVDEGTVDFSRLEPVADAGPNLSGLEPVPEWHSTLAKPGADPGSDFMRDAMKAPGMEKAAAAYRKTLPETFIPPPSTREERNVQQLQTLRDQGLVQDPRDYNVLKDLGLTVTEGGKELFKHALPETLQGIKHGTQHMAGDALEANAKKRVDRSNPMERMRAVENAKPVYTSPGGEPNEEAPDLYSLLSPDAVKGREMQADAQQDMEDLSLKRQLRAMERVAENPDYFGERWAENPSLARTVVSAAPSIPGMALTFINAPAGLSLMTMQEAAPAYTEMRAAGQSPLQAAENTAVFAVGTYLLERLPFDASSKFKQTMLAKRLGPKKAAGVVMLLSGAAEAPTELAQEMFQWSVTNGYEGTLEEFLAEVDIGEVMASSFLMGSTMRGGAEFVEAAARHYQNNPEALTTLDGDLPVYKTPEGATIDLRPQPTTDNPQPTTENPQPTTENPQPITDNPQPTTSTPTRSSRPVAVPESGEWVADTPKGEMQLRGAWKVVDAAELTSSDEQGYDQGLQPRNREAQSSLAQVDEIARNLNPARLLDSPSTDTGAPIVGADGQVISGNGRVMALRSAYAMGTAEGYRAQVQAEADRLGVDTSGMQNPVLVRALPEDQNNLSQIAELSNRPQILERSAAEMAKADAELLSPALLDTLDMERPLSPKGNPEFFAGFVGAANDASLRKADGSLDPVATQRRVGNAIVAALAAGHPQAREVIGTLTERSAELGLQGELDALARSAPALIRTGTLKPEYDLRKAFGSAMSSLVDFAQQNEQLRSQKLPEMSIQDYTGMPDMFEAKDTLVDELTVLLMRMEPKDLAATLARYTELAGNIDTSTVDMFGESNASALEVLQRAAAQVQEGTVPEVAAVRESEAGGGYTSEGRKSVDFVSADELSSYLETHNVPESERANKVREQLDFFSQIDGREAGDLYGRGDATRREVGSESNPGEGYQERLKNALLDPFNSDQWSRFFDSVKQRVVRASAVLREHYKGVRTEWNVEGVQIAGPKDLMALSMMNRDPYVETFKVVYQDADGVVLRSEVVSVGNLGSAMTLNGKQLAERAPANAVGISVVHNHPGGSIRPSTPDDIMTKHLSKQLVDEGLQLVDHVITDDWKYYSYRNSAAGVLPGPVYSVRKKGEVLNPDPRSLDEAMGDVTPGDAPAWSLLKRDDLPRVSQPDVWLRMVKALRNGSNEMIHVGLANTQNALVTMLQYRVDELHTAKGITKMLEDLKDYPEAARAFVDFPEFQNAQNAMGDTRTIEQAFENSGGVLLVDLAYSYPGENKMYSARENGFLKDLNRGVDRKIQGEFAQHHAEARRRVSHIDGTDLRERGAEYPVSSQSRQSDSLGFYSSLAENINGMKQDVFQPEQLKGAVQKLPGVKQEELNDLGFFDWLDGAEGKVTKGEVLAFIESAGPRLQEVVKGDVDAKAMAEYGMPFSQLRSWEQQDILGGDTKYEQYQVPGATNYREVLLTLPDDRPQGRTGKYVLTRNGTATTKPYATLEDANRVLSNVPESLRGEYAINEVNDGQSAFELPQYRSSHWDEPNVLAHVRLNDRTGPNGEKVLFVEEIQSDLHQEGRKKGYKGQFDRLAYAKDYLDSIPARAQKIAKKMIMTGDSLTDGGFDADWEQLGNLAPDADHNMIHEARDEADIAEREFTPNAPFKKSWAMLAFKRVLRMAVEQGYDSVSWTPGEVQNERYDLSKQVSEIRYRPSDNTLQAWKKDLGTVEYQEPEIEQTVEPDKLDEVIGKDAAEKALNGTPDAEGWVSLKGQDLKVGGAGMKGFYDNILPKEVGKYVKKLDKSVRVGTMNIGTPLKGFPTFTKDRVKEVWSLPITDAMRDKTLDGLAIYEPAAKYGSGNAKADVGDITGAGWPGGEVQDRYRVQLPEAPVTDEENAPGPLSRWIGRPVQVGLDSFLQALEGVEGVAQFSTVPDVESGIRVDVDPYALQGQVDTSAEGWRDAWEQGAAGFVGALEDLPAAVRSISLPADVFSEVKPKLQKLVDEWDGHVREDGMVVLTRPGHTRNILELPELGEMAVMLADGAIPQVRRSFRSQRWLGVFRHGDGEKVELRADIFQLLTPQEMSRLRERARAYAEKVREDEGLESEDEVREVAKERYKFLVNQAKGEARKNNPKLASKVLAHELGHWVDHLPDSMINKRGNILGRMASVTKYLKSTLNQDPAGPHSISKQDRSYMRSQARRQVRESGMSPKDEGFNQAVNKRFQQLKQMRQRESGIISKEEVFAELENFIAWWRGSDAMEDYFKQPAEMYAEAISGFILNPAELGRRAPVTYGLIEAYLAKKPQVKRIWDKLQLDISSGQVMKDRVTRLREGFREGDRAEQAKEQALELGKTEFRDALERGFDRKYGPVYRRSQDLDKDSRVEMVEKIAQYRYRTNHHERLMQEVNTEVLNNLVDQNLTWEDLEEYLFHYRVINEREDVANPLFWNVSASQDRLTEWRRSIGGDRFQKLEETRRRMRKLYEEHVLIPVRESGALDPKLMEYLEGNEAYATFAVHRGEADAFERALNSRYGTGVSSGIYKQHGTLQKVRGPATATVEKGIRLIDMAYRNVAVKGMIDMMKVAHPDEIVPAEMRWDGRKMVPAIVSNGKRKTVMYLEGGKVQAYNVPAALADAWETNGHTDHILLQKLNSIFSQKMKALFTGWNYGIWPILWMRDVQDYKRRMPRASNFPGGGPQYFRKFPRAVKAASSVVNGDPNADAKAAMDRGLTISSANFRGIWNDEQAVERLLSKYNQPAMQDVKDNNVLAKVKRGWNRYIETGQILERASKIAGMLYMDEHFQDMPEYQRNQKVRQFAGSQDFLDTPAFLPVIDLFQMFYNPWKQGWRSEIQSLKQNGTAVWSYNQMMYSVLPQLLKYAIYAGAAKGALALMFGDDEADEIEKQMRSISEYDLMASHVIPMGWDDRDERTVRYLRLPMSESQRLVAATVWKVMKAMDSEEAQGAGQNLQAAVSYAGDQLPSGNPLLNVAGAWWHYIGQGKNPVDPRTGYDIIPRAEFEARDKRAMEHLAKYSWNNLGGTVFTRFQLHEPEREKSTMEKFLEMPIVSNTAGRFIRISNRGLYDSVRMIDDRVQRERAQDRLDVRDSVRDEEVPDIQNAYQFQVYERELMKNVNREMPLEERILDGASSQEAELKMRQKLQQLLR